MTGDLTRHEQPSHDVRQEPSHDVAPSSPIGDALLSAVVPGLGQLAQRRPLTAVLQFGTVAAYLVAAYSAGGGRALWLAVLWNAWSSIEAYWRAPR